MAYNYQTERPELFTTQGQVLFRKIRANVNYHIEESGAVRADKAYKGLAGSSFQFIACLERMEELGEIICLSPEGTWTQHMVYTRMR